MTEPHEHRFIFGRYTREECGLPPIGEKPWNGGGMTLRRLFGLLAIMAVLGWLGGMGMARWREHWMSMLPSRVAAASSPAGASELMERGRIYATALPSNYRIRRDLAVASMTAAEKSPRRMGYYANAANLFRGIDAAGVPEAETFATELTAAGAYAETGDYHDAFAALDRADAGLAHVADEELRRSLRLILVNTQAYFLATAGKEEGGDAEKALQLARLMITSRDALPGGGHASGSAALLDTYATALHENGETERALATQSLALGLADAHGLEVYLRHYDEFCKGKENGK